MIEITLVIYHELYGEAKVRIQAQTYEAIQWCCEVPNPHNARVEIMAQDFSFWEKAEETCVQQ